MSETADSLDGLDFDNLDDLLNDFDGITVEGGVDNSDDDGCEGGACKL
ncbi:Uncharacterised protein [Moraxella caviae]|uniref:Uncharacterized protein n=1 Tax=Moraxella caviae TaxID=34060 RepID=A0A378R7U5_9GAMM|nr:hypothetical protein [Moraxella caviae]STZ10651.1 Uncharacterised protein [Moraxella caviae]VEW10558.1 Uncharacterised protein [Moraxella caviae]